MMTHVLIFAAEYEAEAWETGSRHSDETGYHSKAPSGNRSHAPPSRTHSPRPSYHQSQAGDYYRDTNLTNPQGSTYHPNGSQSNLSHYGGAPSQFGMPTLPFLPFGGSASVHGSDYGGAMGMPAAMPYPPTGSGYGMMPNAPRNTFMTNMNMFGGSGDIHGSQGGFAPPMAPGLMGGMGGQRPMSTFSLATTVNPFASGPSMSTDPSDEELITALRAYLSTQDLMTVTKK